MMPVAGRKMRSALAAYCLDYRRKGGKKNDSVFLTTTLSPSPQGSCALNQTAYPPPDKSLEIEGWREGQARMALADNPSLIPSTHVGWLTRACNSSVGETIKDHLKYKHMFEPLLKNASMGKSKQFHSLGVEQWLYMFLLLSLF